MTDVCFTDTTISYSVPLDGDAGSVHKDYAIPSIEFRGHKKRNGLDDGATGGDHFGVLPIDAGRQCDKKGAEKGGDILHDISF